MRGCSSRVAIRASCAWPDSCSAVATSRWRSSTSPEKLPDAILDPNIDIAVLDGADAVAEALRTANATRARRPEVPVIIAADTGGKSPSGVRVFDRWNETEELLQDVERLLSERLAGAAPPGRS